VTGEKRTEYGAHWWGGRERAEGPDFSLSAPRGCPLGWIYPRAEGPEQDEAWSALESAAPPWSERRIRDRARNLRAVARELEGLTTDAEELGTYLGLSRSEWREFGSEWREDLERGWRHRSWRPSPAGVVLVRAHWTEGVADLFGRVGTALIEGASVLVVSDERLPQAADLVVEAWSRRSVEPGALAVLHGVRDEGCRELAEREACRRVEVVGTDRELASWLQEPREAQPRLRTREVKSGEIRLAADDDVERCAAGIVARAFGRVQTLGGQLPGALARVHCDERIFSRLTECLLEVLEGEESVELPPCIDRAAAADHHKACMRGLDQGATLIVGSEELGAPVGGSSDRPRVAPAVLTNVEPEMEVARWRRPTPVLSLIRTPRNGPS